MLISETWTFTSCNEAGYNLTVVNCTRILRIVFLWCLSTATTHGITVPISFRALMTFLVEEFVLENTRRSSEETRLSVKFVQFEPERS
jgi:hypothetical protein